MGKRFIGTGGRRRVLRRAPSRGARGNEGGDAKDSVWDGGGSRKVPAELEGGGGRR